MSQRNLWPEVQFDTREKKREERQIGRRKDKWKKSRKERAKNGWSDRLYESTIGRQTLEMSAWEQRNHLSEIQMLFYVKKISRIGDFVITFHIFKIDSSVSVDVDLTILNDILVFVLYYICT